MVSSRPSIAITGGQGFLGWHMACRLRAIHGIEPRRLGRDDLANPNRLDSALADVDAVIHLAGVNRADTYDEVESGNAEIARVLGEGLERQGRPIDVSFANSTQSVLDNPYGRGKAKSAEILLAAARSSGGTFTDVVLPNLFGEHGRPGYNSFVATFAHEVAAGRRPTVTVDREVPLLHAQDAAAAMIDAVTSGTAGQVSVDAEPRLVSDVLTRLEVMHALYSRGEIPPLTDPFEVALFNTYRAARFPGPFPFAPQVHADGRGRLFEAVRAHGGAGQAFLSTTVPGATRGDHYHLRKVERFFVIQGEAEIAVRRLLHDDVVTFRLSGEVPSFVDMPTMWAHSITNVGDTELLTMFWSDQLLDPNNPDQYPESVQQQGNNS